MANELVFDGRGIEELGRDLRAAARAITREVDKTLVEIGGEITVAAREIAARKSKSIPPTVRMKAMPGAVLIQAGSPAVPLAALYELGNKRAKRTATTFRHPVFGNRNVWVEQRRHPFLRPAIVADRRQITKRMEATWERALAPHRLAPL